MRLKVSNPLTYFDTSIKNVDGGMGAYESTSLARECSEFIIENPTKMMCITADKEFELNGPIYQNPDEVIPRPWNFFYIKNDTLFFNTEWLGTLSIEQESEPCIHLKYGALEILKNSVPISPPSTVKLLDKYLPPKVTQPKIQHQLPRWEPLKYEKKELDKQQLQIESDINILIRHAEIIEEQLLQLLTEEEIVRQEIIQLIDKKEPEITEKEKFIILIKRVIDKKITEKFKIKQSIIQHRESKRSIEQQIDEIERKELQIKERIIKQYNENSKKTVVSKKNTALTSNLPSILKASTGKRYCHMFKKSPDSVTVSENVYSNTGSPDATVDSGNPVKKRVKV